MPTLATKKINKPKDSQYLGVFFVWGLSWKINKNRVVKKQEERLEWPLGFPKLLEQP